jgi:hypothetical protein
MSAAVVVRELLKARTQVTTLVPAERLFTGAMPLGAMLPAIVLIDVSGNEIPTVARNGTHSTIRARVQVTVYAKNYETQEKVLLACKLPGIPRGIIKGFKVNAVEPMGTGPAIPPGDDGIFERSRDFMVTFKEAN